MQQSNILAVIPARYQSSRFPGKPLVDILGKSMIQRVYEQVQQVEMVDKVIVATDDARIFEHLQKLHYEVEMTSPAHTSGTDRCAEVALRYPDYAYIINVQGDEPFIQPQQVASVIEPLIRQQAQISTLAKKIDHTAALFNPNTVKVVKNKSGVALYFSRQAIPFARGVEPEHWLENRVYFKHLGLYGFQRATLLEVTQLPNSSLELAEGLEQLRWLENGYSIHVATTDQESFGIDTPEDLERAIQYYQL